MPPAAWDGATGAADGLNQNGDMANKEKLWPMEAMGAEDEGDQSAGHGQQEEEAEDGGRVVELVGSPRPERDASGSKMPRRIAL